MPRAVDQARIQQHDAEHRGPTAGSLKQCVVWFVAVDDELPGAGVVKESPEPRQVGGGIAACDVTPIDDGADGTVLIDQNVLGMEIPVPDVIAKIDEGWEQAADEDGVAFSSVAEETATKQKVGELIEAYVANRLHQALFAEGLRLGKAGVAHLRGLPHPGGMVLRALHPARTWRTGRG